MSRSEDITNLFRQFGGEPSDYREMGRDNSAAHARERWPLLAAIDVGIAKEPVSPVKASRPAEELPELPIRTPSRLFEGAPQARVHPSVAPSPALRVAPVQAPAPAVPISVQSTGRIEPVLLAPTPSPSRTLIQPAAPPSGAARMFSPIDPAGTHTPRELVRPAAPEVATLSVANEFGNDLASVFQRLQRDPAHHDATPQASSSRDLLLQKLLRS